MLKISIVLVTTTAFAALLVAYPFSPQPAAQGPQLALAAVREAPPPAPQADPTPPEAIAALEAPAEKPKAESAKTLPATSRTRDADRVADPRIPSRPYRPPAEPERARVKHVVQNTDVRTTYPARTHGVARQSAMREAKPTYYPAYTGGRPAYMPKTMAPARHTHLSDPSARPYLGQSRGYVLASADQQH